MLPKYPIFKTLEIKDQEEIESYTRPYFPYSDYNFVSMVSWNIHGRVKVSECNNNLVVLFDDYVSDERFLSFIGTNIVDNTIATIFEHSLSIIGSLELKLIPQCVVNNINNKESIHICDDIDNYDYIYSCESFRKFSGNKYHARRRFVNIFKRNWGSHSEILRLDICDPMIIREIFELFNKWAISRNKNESEIKKESIALCRYLEFSKHLDAVVLGLMINAKLSGFAVIEKLYGRYGIIHFEKADISYRGIFEYLMQNIAIYFESLGCDYINGEQDLGIDGLRKSKSLYRPYAYFKKYKIKLK